MIEGCEVLGIGETMGMLTPVDGGHLDSNSTLILRAGGAESNVTALLAQLGHRTAWASRLGLDPFGDTILGDLADSGVDTSLVERVGDRPTGVYFKDPTPSGTTVYYYRTGSAAADMDPHFVAALLPAAPRVVHLSGITSALSDGCRALMRHLVVDRPFADAVVSLDINYRSGLWDSAEAAVELCELAQSSDIVFVGRDEAELLWGTRTAEDVRALLDRPRVLVVKDGALEAIEFDGLEVRRVAAPTVHVVDRVGAGDAFAAGWLSGYLRDQEPVTRLRLGHLVASHILASPTDHALLPTVTEITDTVRLDPAHWRTAKANS